MDKERAFAKIREILGCDNTRIDVEDRLFARAYDDTPNRHRLLLAKDTLLLDDSRYFFALAPKDYVYIHYGGEGKFAYGREVEPSPGFTVKDILSFYAYDLEGFLSRHSPNELINREGYCRDLPKVPYLYEMEVAEGPLTSVCFLLDEERVLGIDFYLRTETCCFYPGDHGHAHIGITFYLNDIGEVEIPLDESIKRLLKEDGVL